MADDARVAGMVLEGLLDNAEKEVAALRQQLQDAMVLTGLLLQQLGGKAEIPVRNLQLLQGLSVVQKEDPTEQKWIFVLEATHPEKTNG